MTFATPFFLWVAVGIAAATVALHLLAWRRPPETPLPTARFAPERPIRMVSRAVRPADLALLALRVLVIALIGVALAGPSLAPRRTGMGRVVVADRSRGAASGVVAAGVRAELRAGDALVVFDSVAREVGSPAADSVATGGLTAPGSLSPALVAAVRAARRLQRERDSVEIVVVSAFGAAEVDAATRAIRMTWPGAVRTVRAAGTPGDTATAARVDVRAPDGDAVAVALGLAGALPAGGTVRVVRDAVTAADSAWARGGNTLVVWPAGAPQEFTRRAQADTAFAVTAPSVGSGADADSRAATVVGRFLRSVLPPPGGHTVARWSDGEPAATEAALGAGCMRAVAVPVPFVGDLALSPAFRHFAARMAERCGGTRASALLSDSALALVLPPTLAANERTAVASVASNAPVSKLTAWLLGLALAAAVAEMWVRRGGTDATA
ncbi:MAG TPA: BatA domain-containing protein [Gemmatimonadaceae bacterium]|nr:BatA domain-containing protein [Gemmatimonadaceae bacterium]